MNLMAELEAGISWRRLQALLCGLGPNSAFVNHAAAKEEARAKGGEIIEDPEAAKRRIREIWGG